MGELKVGEMGDLDENGMRAGGWGKVGKERGPFCE